MKLAYLLQTIKGVPLNYYFRLHSYGPFDSDVLSDLDQAESLGALKSELIHFPNRSGYGYEFSVGPKPGFVQSKAEATVAEYHDAIRWALTEFGEYPAADLELISTVVFADREAVQQCKRIPIQQLCRTVKAIKPRFDEAYIGAKIKELVANGLLSATDMEKPSP